MQLGFFTMPIHPLDKDWRQSLREDQEAFLLADELGFSEAMSASTPPTRPRTSPPARCSSRRSPAATKQIRLGTGTVNLPNTHPARVAGEIAMLDHLLDGRLNFGISPGGLPSDAEAFGTLDNDRNAMFVECIDQVLNIWASDPPYDIEGRFWTVDDREDADRRDRPGRHPQAAAEAASADHLHGRGALLERRDRGRGARVGADLGQFPAAAMGGDPLAPLRRGLRARGPPGRARQLARRQEHLRG